MPRSVRHALATTALVLLCLPLVACIETTHGDGIAGFIQQPTPGPIHEIEIAGALRLDVYVENTGPGGESGILIQGDQNLVPLITNVQTGRRLTLSTETYLASVNPLRVTVYSPNLEVIAVSRLAEARVRELAGEWIGIESSGSGKVDLSGSIEAVEVAASGSSRVTLDVESRLLTVSASERSRIVLGGRVDDIEVAASNRAQVSGRVDSRVLSIFGDEETSVDLRGRSDEMLLQLEGAAEVQARWLRTRYGYITSSGESHAEVCVERLLDIEAWDVATVQYSCLPREVIVAGSETATITER